MKKNNILFKIISAIFIILILIQLIKIFIASAISSGDSIGEYPKNSHDFIKNKTLRIPNNLIYIKPEKLGLKIYDYKLPKETVIESWVGSVYIDIKPDSNHFFNNVYMDIDDQDYLFNLKISKEKFTINSDLNKKYVANVIETLKKYYGQSFKIFKRKEIFKYEKKILLIWKKRSNIIQMSFVYLTKDKNLNKFNLCDLQIQFTINHNKVFGYDNYPDLKEYELLDKNVLENYGIKVNNIP